MPDITTNPAGPRMRVERVGHTHGSRVEPPYNHDWDDLTKLRWRAAVVALDTGLDVTVDSANSKVRRGGGPWAELVNFDIYCEGSVMQAGDYWTTWHALNGVSFGARAANRASVDDGSGEQT